MNWYDQSRPKKCKPEPTSLPSSSLVNNVLPEQNMFSPHFWRAGPLGPIPNSSGLPSICCKFLPCLLIPGITRKGRKQCLVCASASCLPSGLRPINPWPSVLILPLSSFHKTYVERRCEQSRGLPVPTGWSFTCSVLTEEMPSPSEPSTNYLVCSRQLVLSSELCPLLLFVSGQVTWLSSWDCFLIYKMNNE